jgi:uncharacterized protein with NRDE domain
MCLIVFAHRVHPDFPLLVAANRDEYHARPARPLHAWKSVPGLYAGLDEQAGGTWLGLHESGRFAAITNHRNPPSTPQQPRSRGLLALDYLGGDDSADDYLQRLSAEAGSYAGFNLLLGDGDALYYYSNIAGARRRLEPGIYGVSNALLNTPWPKLMRAKRGIAAALEAGPQHHSLQAAVASRTTEPDDQLPDTGLGVEQERMLSAQFILSPAYGTRATTTLMVDGAGNADLLEHSYNAAGEVVEEASARLALSRADR